MAEKFPIGQPQDDVDTMHALLNESDRGLVLTLAARIDDALEHVLRDCCGNADHNVLDAMFDNGPLATFSAKIDLCYSLGIVERDLHRSLTILRRLRNEFAHSKEPLTLLSQTCASRLASMIDEPIDSYLQRRLSDADNPWRQRIATDHAFRNRVALTVIGVRIIGTLDSAVDLKYRMRPTRFLPSKATE